MAEEELVTVPLITAAELVKRRHARNEANLNCTSTHVMQAAGQRKTVAGGSGGGISSSSIGVIIPFWGGVIFNKPI